MLRLSRALPSALVATIALASAACFGGGGSDDGPPESSEIPTATIPAELPTVRPLGESNVSTGGRRTYTIRQGDTFSSLADRFGVTLDELIAANPGVDPVGLVEGDVINLPESISGSPVAATATVAGAEATATPEPVEEQPTAVEEIPTETPAPLPTDTPVPPAETPTSQSLGTTYIVQAGDTFASIAGRFGVSIESLAAANPQVDPNGMQVGQVLFIPPSGG